MKVQFLSLFSKFKLLTVSCLAVFAPIKPLITVAIILVIVDLITGIFAAHKKGEKIDSAGIRRSISKILIYLTALMIGFLTEKFMLDNYLPISKIVASLVGTTEIFSIYENLNVLQGKNIFGRLINMLGSQNDALKKKADVTPPKS